MKLDNIESVIQDVREGRMIVIVDDADRENEGDLMIAAEKVKANDINFMLQHGKGLICVSLTTQRLQELNLPFQVQHNTSPFGTNFAISFDLKESATIGNSAEARANAIRATTISSTKAEDFVRPGHVFPLGAVEGGVLKRRGQTEGSLDLSRLAGLYPAGVICEIMDENGVMLRGKELQNYCIEHGFKITSVEELVNYILKNTVSLRRISEKDFDISKLNKDFKVPAKLYTYLDFKSQIQHYAVKIGNGVGQNHIHKESISEDLFNEFLNYDNSFINKINSIVNNGSSGTIVYLREGGETELANYIFKDLNFS